MTLVVLVYHKIVAALGDDPFGLEVTQATFSSHVDAFSSACGVIDAATFLSDPAAIVNATDVYALFSFDDAYEAGIERGIETLAVRGLRGILFAPAWHVDHPEPYWWDTMQCHTRSASPPMLALRERLMRETYEDAAAAVAAVCAIARPRLNDQLVTWDRLRDLAEVADVGCHGHLHDCFARVPNETLRHRIQAAKNRFHEQGISTVPLLAYPYGDSRSVRDEQIEAVIRPEFELAFLAQHQAAGVSSDPLWRWKVPRVFASERCGSRMLSTARDLAARASPLTT